MEKLNIKVEGGGAETELVVLSVQRKNWESRNYLFVGSSSLAYNDELNNSITNLQSQIDTAKIDLNTKIDNNINSFSLQINTINNSITNLQSQIDTINNNINNSIKSFSLQINTINNNIKSFSSQINTINNNITNLQSQIASSSSTYTTDYIDMDSCSKVDDIHQIIIEEKTIKLANGQEQKIRIPYIMAKREQGLCMGIAMKAYPKTYENDWYWSSDVNNKNSSYHYHSD